MQSLLVSEIKFNMVTCHVGPIVFMAKIISTRDTSANIRSGISNPGCYNTMLNVSALNEKYNIGQLHMAYNIKYFIM